MVAPNPEGRISLAILALGGQGGGVLADWILATAEANGFIAQGTSVPGVAQRTGSTIYYIELFPAGRTPPVLALSPVPGDVDIVIASELMEAGRAIQRGFVSAGRTVLIGSTHRIYAIAEKSARHDGRRPSERILEAAFARAARFIGFDMDESASRAGSVISSVMLGALAASGALPFPRAAFEAAITAGGIAVPANLRGFAAGWDAAGTAPTSLREQPTEAPATSLPAPRSAAGHTLAARISAELPPGAHRNSLEAVKRLADYQDAAYAALFLDRLKPIADLDDGTDNHKLTAETARGLALWMSYEDTIRVADLKTRDTRLARVRNEVKAGDAELLRVTEYMHPRLQEVCETLPAGLGRFILSSPALRGLLERFFQKGRHVETTQLRWFVPLWLLARARTYRRGTLRYQEEQHRITAWLGLLTSVARQDVAAATEIALTQRLIKGYGDTFERGLRQFGLIAAAIESRRNAPGLARLIATLRDAALADETDTALLQALAAANIGVVSPAIA